MKSCFRVGLLLGAAILASYSLGQNSRVGALKGKPLPAVSFTLLDGGKATTASLKGKVVLLDFWASWCRPCLAASPAIDRLTKKYRSQGLETIGVNALEGVPGPASAKNYKKKHGYSYKLAYDSDPAAKKLGVEALPVFLVIDRKGVVREVLTGLPDGKVEKLEAALDAAIKAAISG